MAHMGTKLHSDIVRTIGLLFCMCESLFSTVKYVVMESGFCVANCIVELAAKRLYVGDIIKKRWFWPKSVPGDLIGRHFEEKEVEGLDML